MQWAVIALCYLGFALLVLLARTKQHRRFWTVLFMVVSALAMASLFVWGIFRNF